MILRLLGLVEEMPIAWDPTDPCNDRRSSPEHVNRTLEQRNAVRLAGWRRMYDPNHAVNERLDTLRRHGAC